MQNIILFDLYDTVLKDKSFEFERGLKYLHTHFQQKCTYEEFNQYSITLLPLYEERKITNNEIAFIRDTFPMYCKEFEVNPQVDLEKLDYQIMNEMQEEYLEDETRISLEKLYAQGVKMYILSNSIFLSSSNKRLLNDFGIEKYFIDLYSSADFGKRKPDSSFFEYAISKILQENELCSKNDIFYVGNDYQTDVIGSKNVGLKTIWYNEKKQVDSNNLNVCSIAEFSDILKVIK
ncbi:HAD family hydrolase [Anaeromicropila herbilytica]|uniref:Noncanonical pyrimidine nucleotidase, YjjG family protein n=1 Tax=Anaeromicropila herbilytica TaxID=2785025 RepID=A0A7R7EKM6_9FIRM|nr:HAD family hydrolase [Anaeromicropila herbilytica]BCN30865.1 noncanonical pyrimidine nucleotidase, YjjG family protein [Anaeromicropila herbilytica]